MTQDTKTSGWVIVQQRTGKPDRYHSLPGWVNIGSYPPLVYPTQESAEKGREKILDRRGVIVTPYTPPAPEVKTVDWKASVEAVEGAIYVSSISRDNGYDYGYEHLETPEQFREFIQHVLAEGRKLGWEPKEGDEE